MNTVLYFAAMTLPQSGAERLNLDAVSVGRNSELQGFIQDLQRALAGNTGVILLTGEPGIGKSHFLDQVKREAQANGFRVLRGFAVDAGGMPPYFPLIQALREPASAATEWGSIVQSLPSALALTGGSPPAKTSKLTPEAERLRLFETLTQIIIAVSEEAPALISLDDMQWADASTWEALTYVLRGLGDARLVVLLALREEALNALDSPATRAIAELSRLRLLRHLPLQPLRGPDIDALVHAILQGPAHAELVAAVSASSDGNPFYIEEILRSLRDAGSIVRAGGEWKLTEEFRRTPRLEPSLTLRLSLGQRLNGLPDEAVGALKHASVLGREFSASLLADMMDVPVQEIEDALTPAMAAGLIKPIPPNWSFNHDVIRETIYSLASDEGRQLHAKAARALMQSPQSLPGVDLAVSLAYHWRLAQDWSEAAEWALEAARAALENHAFSDALEFARSGIELMKRAEAGTSPSVRMLSALELHGNIAFDAAEYGEAEEAFRAGLREAEALGDEVGRARMCLRLGALARRREQADQATAMLNEALAVLDANHQRDEQLFGVLIELAGLEGLTRAHYADAEAFAQRAIGLAKDLKSPGLEATATLALANSRTRSDDPSAGLPLFEHALERALLAGDLTLAAEACASLSNACYWRGEMQAALRYAERRRALAEQASDLFGLRHAYTWKALVLSSFGRWQEARELLDLAEPLLKRLDSPEPAAFLKIVRARIDLETGALDSAYELAREAISVFSSIDPGTLVWYEALFAQICLSLDRIAEADTHVSNLEILLERLPPEALPARSARTALGRVYADMRKVEDAAKCETALRSFQNDYHWTQARLVLGRLAALRGDRRTALADIDAAESWARGQDLQFDVALAQLARIEVLGADAEPDDVARCRTLLEKLNAAPSLKRLATLTNIGGPLAVAGLTPRELEVLRLLAQGLTNRQIAETLVISERTVVNHMSHIFAKLNVEHRSAATAFALRHGL